MQRWIEEGRVRVDGAVLRASAALELGAAVEVEPSAPPPSNAVADARIALAVVFEDDHLIVIDKPAGLVVHPAKGHAEGTLVNALLARPGFLADNADARDPFASSRPGIVHRLDKGTSGLLVVAKDASSREGLKHLFSKHEIDREYVAIVAGAARDATIDTLHGRAKNDRVRFTTRVREGKRAVTHVKVLERLRGATFVACRLETGRTHQIRVHLAEQLGTPVLGDPLYAKPPKDPELRAVAAALGHQALHARVLGFVHPITGVAMRWESPPPRDFADALAALRSPDL